MWLVYALAVARLCGLLQADKLTDPARRAVLRRLDEDNTLHRGVAYLTDCPWCMSVWVGGATAVLAWWHGTNPWMFVPAAALAISQVTGMIAPLHPGYRDPDPPPAEPEEEPDYHAMGVYCGEPAHCPPPYPGALPGTPYLDPITQDSPEPEDGVVLEDAAGGGDVWARRDGWLPVGIGGKTAAEQRWYSLNNGGGPSTWADMWRHRIDGGMYDTPMRQLRADRLYRPGSGQHGLDVLYVPGSR